MHLRSRRGKPHVNNTYLPHKFHGNGSPSVMDHKDKLDINWESNGQLTPACKANGSSEKHKKIVSRLNPSAGFVNKDFVSSDLMTRSRVRREASLNAAAKVNVYYEPSSSLAGRSISDRTSNSKKPQNVDSLPDYGNEVNASKERCRPRLANISTNNENNFVRTTELPGPANSSNANCVQDFENSTTQNHLDIGGKRTSDSDEELQQAKRLKVDKDSTMNVDETTYISDKRIHKGKEVVDVGLQVKLPRPRSSIQCTCRSSTLKEVPIKSYVSTVANGTLVSIPLTKKHCLTPHAPSKPPPEAAQGHMVNLSPKVAVLNSRAMLSAILSKERSANQASKSSKQQIAQLIQKKGPYEHGLGNTVPGKLKIPKINFAATSTSNFGGRKMVANPKTSNSSWSKSRLVSHDGPKRTNGWCYLGSPIVKPYFYNETKVMRKYYIGIKRNDEVIYVRDSVLLKSGPRRRDLPFVARVSGFWEEEIGPHSGEMMMSVLWYYRPEQTEMGKQDNIHGENEIFASRHKDDNSVACIVDKCYVISYPEYCRYRAAIKRSLYSRMSPATLVPPAESTRTTREKIPSTCDPKLVFFCRQIYDYRMARILKNPFYV